jgi:hypothetical protein
VPYGIFCLSLYFNPTIKELYQQAHGVDSPAPVKINDVVLLLQGLFILVLLVSQCIFYDKAKQQTLSRVAVIGCLAIWVSIGAMLLLCARHPFAFDSSLTMLSFINYLGYVKTFCTFIKYAPQVHTCVSQSCSLHADRFSLAAGVLQLAAKEHRGLQHLQHLPRFFRRRVQHLANGESDCCSC